MDLSNAAAASVTEVGAAKEKEDTRDTRLRSCGDRRDDDDFAPIEHYPPSWRLSSEDWADCGD